MHPLLSAIIAILEVGFCVGIIGSAIVVVWVAIDDLRELAREEPGEKPAGQVEHEQQPVTT